MMRLSLIIAAVVLTAACRTKEPAVSDTAADTAAAASGSADASAPGVSAGQSESMTPPDTSPLPPPADASGNLTGETTKRGGTLGQDPPRRDSVIGRDSAFGPIGTMDSDGTIRPIKKR